MVVLIPYVFDEFQSGLFVVAVSLSHTTSWVTCIVRRVSYKGRMGCVDCGVLITRGEAVSPGLDPIVVTLIPSNYAILPAHDNSGATVVVGRVIGNHRVRCP